MLYWCVVSVEWNVMFGGWFGYLEGCVIVCNVYFCVVGCGILLVKDVWG